MKKIIIGLMLLFTFSALSQDKAIEVIYKKTVLLDESLEGNNNDTKKKAKELLEKVNEEMNSIKYKLVFNDSVSCFKQIKSLKTDISSNSLTNMLSSTLGNTDGVFFTNLKNKETIHQTRFKNKQVLVTNNLDSIKWTLTNESKIIEGYKVYKATTKIKFVSVRGLIEEQIIAWYTTNLPIGFGPTGLGNLPGLILELQRGKIVIYVDKINFNVPINVEKLKPVKGKKIDNESLIKLQLEQIGQ